MFSALGKNFSRQHFEILFLFFRENRVRHFKQIFSNRDNLHEMSNPVFWENKKNINLLSAEYAQRAVKIITVSFSRPHSNTQTWKSLTKLVLGNQKISAPENKKVNIY